MYERVQITPEKAAEVLSDRSTSEKVVNLYSNLAIPSYVHGYSLAIDYMYNWFNSKFEKGYFKGGIYVDGKHVLDDYKNKYDKLIIKGQQPRARIEPRIEHDYDREGLDAYLAPPNILFRKSPLSTSFFKDYDRKLFLGINMRALRMDFNFKVRVNTRAEQLDIAQRMELYFRVGSSQYEDLSADFHVPKALILDIAEKAGFEIKRGEVVDIIDFLEYLNRHSELPFLFKIRAINQKAEYFIRLNGLYTHILTRDKLSLDDGERDGKLDFRFHVEMNSVLTIPVPQFYAYYSAEEYMTNIDLKEYTNDTVAIYSINVVDIPRVNEKGWMLGAQTDYASDEGEEEIDLSILFNGENSLAKAINHTLSNGVSPYHFIDIKVFRQDDLAKYVPIEMDWEKRIAKFKDGPQPEDIYHIAIYYDRAYINELDISLQSLNDNRISKSNLDKSDSSNLLRIDGSNKEDKFIT